MQQRSAFIHFAILNITVAISGFSQGMLLPLIAIIFEQDGVSSSINGLHAASLYIGMLLITPFLEAPLRRFGFKPFILTGGFIVILTLFAFPLWKSLWFWFMLRLLIGVGDNLLHFGTQTWITFASSSAHRGRNISIYGLSFGLGYGLGPLLTRLLTIHEAAPFIVSGCLSLLAWLTIFYLKNEFPADNEIATGTQQTNMLKRFASVFPYAWVALLLPFSYGFLEASLSGIFPVYALQSGISVNAVSIMLPAFAIGSIVFQIPLGLLSDKYGRKQIIAIILSAGFLIFTIAGIMQASTIALFICFFIAGMLVGSTFSLGLAYMVDLVPQHLLISGNLLAGICLSLGSITGPFVGGLTIQYAKNISFFYTISGLLAIVFVCVLLFKPKKIG